MEEQLKKIVSSTIKVPETNLGIDDDLVAKHSVDSMQRIEIVIAVEKEFGVEIPDDIASQLRTISDLIGLIRKQKTNK